jgi:hypothetical protein
MTVQEAKAHIFDRVCSQYHHGNTNEFIDGETVRQDKDISEEVFGKALKEFMEIDGHRFVEVDTNRRLKLGVSGLKNCVQKTNPFR